MISDHGRGLHPVWGVWVSPSHWGGGGIRLIVGFQPQGHITDCKWNSVVCVGVVADE